jgi:hypothetical protein
MWSEHDGSCAWIAGGTLTHRQRKPSRVAYNGLWHNTKWGAQCTSTVRMVTVRLTWYTVRNLASYNSSHIIARMSYNRTVTHPTLNVIAPCSAGRDHQANSVMTAAVCTIHSSCYKEIVTPPHLCQLLSDHLKP